MACDCWNHKKRIEKRARSYEETFDVLEEMAVFDADPTLYLAKPRRIIEAKKKKEWEKLTAPPKGKEG